MTDTEAMHEALALAREAADEGEVPVGCIVTDGERIVGRVAKQQFGSGERIEHGEMSSTLWIHGAGPFKL